MAVEVACQSYEFADEQESFGYLTEMGMEGYNPKVKINTRENSSPSTSNPTGIYHSYTHDVESIWWVLVWTVFAYGEIPVPTDEISVKCAEVQKSSYRALFPSDMSIEARLSFFKKLSTFTEYIKQVSPFFHGQVSAIDFFRSMLLTKYKQTEANIQGPIYPSGANTIHDAFLKVLKKREINEGDIVSVFGRASGKISAEDD